MDILGFITLVITGFTSCAEFGSYAFAPQGALSL
jgi:hypothetical protein